ncbi:MAG: hypothetical protein KF708_15520 [Pirellulales bacterium]|nr:hypothetical protein [Pirellulales bacterium]
MTGPTLIPGARCRSGFSILEVLLALALSTALLAGLFSALSLFMRSFDSGRTHVEEAQLARSLLRQISRDLRRAVVESAARSAGGDQPLALPSDFLPSAESAADPLSPAELYRTTVLSPLRDSTETPVARTLRLAGTSDRLDVCVRAGGGQESLAALVIGSEAPSAESSAFVTGASNSDSAGALRKVSYFCYDSTNPDRMLAQQNEFSPATVNAEAGIAQTGLVRREQPWLHESSGEEPLRSNAATAAEPESTSDYGTPAAGLSASSPMTTSSAARANEYRPPSDVAWEDLAETLTPEVERVAFRYFDGSTWYSSWDSASDGGLPMAVDIAFWLAEPADEARRPRRAGQRRADPADTSATRQTAADRSSSREPETAGAFAGGNAANGTSAEDLPDYRLVVYLPLASPRREENPYPELSSPDELNAPLPAAPASPLPSTMAPPTPPAPTRRNSIPSFFRPNAPAPGGAR